jgi:hypothetical protein
VVACAVPGMLVTLTACFGRAGVTRVVVDKAASMVRIRGPDADCVSRAKSIMDFAVDRIPISSAEVRHTHCAAYDSHPPPPASTAGATVPLSACVRARACVCLFVCVCLLGVGGGHPMCMRLRVCVYAGADLAHDLCPPPLCPPRIRSRC